MSHAEEQCLAAGMDAVIVKPFDPVQFYNAIEGMTSVSNASSQRGAPERELR
jgi:CheY-like chemotaxis protein